MGQAGDAATTQIVDYVLGASAADLPDRVRREGLRSFFNILGCTYGGARHDAIERTWASLAPFAGAPNASLLGRAAKSDALTAALLNTLSSSIATYDDTHAEAIVHPSGPVMAAVLAVAEHKPVTGRDLLTAFILGVEIVCRLSKAVSVAPAQGSIAWSQTGICCGVGAALAAARLLALDAKATRQAVGHAASQASGLRVAHGTMCTAMMPSQAAQAGLRAAYFAKAGVTSSERAIEGRYGFLECFAATPHTAHLTQGLRSHFEILANTYKPFPCGIVINPLIDAALQMKAAHTLEPDRIERVEMTVSPGAIALCDRRHPKDEFEGQVSLYHWVAAAFVRGRAGSADGTDAVIREPAMRDFRERVFATASPAMPIDGVDMTVTLGDGRRLQSSLRDCIGSKGRPMTDAQLTAKFEQSAAPVLDAATLRRVVEDCWRLETLADARAVIA
jgi:2-methylcitrate dehydratase PrpD